MTCLRACRKIKEISLPILGGFPDCREICTVELERIDDWTIVSMINFLNFLVSKIVY